MCADSKRGTIQGYARLGGAVAVLCGMAVLAGWSLHPSELKNAAPGSPQTMPNTGLGFVLTGLALWLLARDPLPVLTQRLGILAGGLVAALGLVTMGEYLFGWEAGIDRLLLRPNWPGLGPAFTGRPSMLSAIGLSLFGFGLVFLDTRNRRLRLLGEALAVLPIQIALLALIGYACGVTSFYSWKSLYPSAGMSLLTAVTFVILGGGLIAARPDRGLAQMLGGSTAGSLVARRLLLAPVIIPLVTGLAGIGFRRMGYFNAEFVGWSFSFLNIFIFTAVIWWVGSLLHSADTVRRQAEAELREANERLEVRVRERTAELTQAGEALRLSERRFRALIEHGSDSIALIDAANKILYVSPAVLTVEGYRPEELLGRSGLENTHPDDLPLVHQIVQQLLANPGVPIPVLWRRRHKDGRWLWLEGVAINLFGDPAVGAIVTNYRDVTGRKVAEAEVRRYVEELRARNEELERFNRVSTGRELRMIELKRQLNELAQEKGRPAVFSLAFASGPEGEMPAAGTRFIPE
ncbi:MAG TPA: PAS domain S-box protein [Candidatus Limnocylindria bacterium]|nr:PAS domain S-box protein [Candidatus Limnocylindria bacterium]